MQLSSHLIEAFETSSHDWLDRVYDLTQRLLLISFLGVSLLPHRALAFAQRAEDFNHPLQFQLPVGQIETLIFTENGPQRPEEVSFRPGLLVSVWASAYSSTEAQTDGDPFTTASGTQVRPGIIAANFLPLGSTVFINGDIYTVEDRLSNRYDNQYMIDVWMGSEAEAFAFGIRLVTMQILSIPSR